MTTHVAIRLHPTTVEECMALLADAYVGRLAFVVDGKPQIVPLNFRYVEGNVVFRTSYGSLLDAVHGSAVAFEIDGWDETDHSGWSVVVHGLAEEVWRPEELRAIRELPLRPWAPGPRDHYVRINPEAITGRRIGPVTDTRGDQP